MGKSRTERSYLSPKNLPDYRTLPAQAKGDFSGGVGLYITRNIPPAIMEENHRWAAETVHLTQPVSAYEGMTSDTISYLWNPDMVLYYQDRFVPLYVLVSAWQEVPKSAIDGVLDTIRTRVLNMALEIRAEVGESDET